MEKKELNIEAFRFVATMFVIILHVLGQGGILKNALQGGAVYWTAWFLEIFAFCSVNCFALITGYVMVDKEIKTKNIINLWIRVLFYSLLFSAVIFSLFPNSISLKGIVTAILPITGKQWWYISSYFALFFLIPFLNAGIERISQQDYRKLLLVILFGVCFISCVLPIDAFVLNNGYSATWLIIVYLFGAYLKKYEIPKKTTALRSLSGFGIVIVITFISKVVIHYFTKNVFGEVMRDEMFVSYISITILFASIFLFLFFLNIKIGDSGFSAKLIRFFSPAALGTYLIHTHPLVFDFIIKDAFTDFANKTPFVMVFLVLITSFAIFTICTIIELLRMQLFNFLRIDQLSENIDNKINWLYLRIFEK